MLTLRVLISITLAMLLTACAGGIQSAAPWQVTDKQAALAGVMLTAAASAGTINQLCVPVAETVREQTGATIYALEGQYGERHAIACKSGVCVDNGLLTKGKYGVRRAFLLSALDRYYTVQGKWACQDGAESCTVNGVVYKASRVKESG